MPIQSAGSPAATLVTVVTVLGSLLVMGFLDARVGWPGPTERVERYVPAKRRFGQLFFYWSAFRVLAGTYRDGVALGDAIHSADQAAARLGEFLGIDGMAEAGQGPSLGASSMGPD